MRIGIDLGGTKIEGVALGRANRVLARRRVPTPRGDYQQTLDAIASLVAALESETGARGSVGIAMPGTISPRTGLVKNANSTWLNDRHLKEDLEAHLARPLRLANDANCFALSEARDGAGAGAKSVIGLILGTGVGSGIVLEGSILEGANAIAGEWGHNPLPAPRDDERPGPLCWCGKESCLEQWLSGPAFEADHRARTGEALAAAAIAARASDGDPACRASLARYAGRLARAVAVLVNIIDPDIIVLGGGLSNIAALAPALDSALPPLVFSDGLETRVRTNVHGDSSGVRGAAWLWEA